MALPILFGALAELPSSATADPCDGTLPIADGSASAALGASGMTVAAHTPKGGGCVQVEGSPTMGRACAYGDAPNAYVLAGYACLNGGPWGMDGCWHPTGGSATTPCNERCLTTVRLDCSSEPLPPPEGWVRHEYELLYPDCIEPGREEGGKCYLHIDIGRTTQVDPMTLQPGTNCLQNYCLVRQLMQATLVNYAGPYSFIRCHQGTTAMMVGGAVCHRSGTNVPPVDIPGMLVAGAFYPYQTMPYYEWHEIPPGAACTRTYTQQVDYLLIQPIHNDLDVLEWGSIRKESEPYIVQNGAGAAGPCPG